MSGPKRDVAGNRAAYHEYFVEDKFEAGIELFGTEVKSLRCGRVNLKDSFCRIDKGELVAYGIHISPYEKGNIFNRDPYRPRKLLMHRKEIDKLFGLVGQKGYSLIPLSIYFSGRWAKMEIGLCKGKKLYDKRAVEAEKSAKREIERADKGNY
ncbi:MAG: SsrA-binding protein SmpB [Clostridia bacterium]|nr:SsrA-binding protein SmpB [Clostridia bacterium]MBR5278631.1 SsrA-binding protein SmpB [Clostridia bacterium]